MNKPFQVHNATPSWSRPARSVCLYRVQRAKTCRSSFPRYRFIVVFLLVHPLYMMVFRILGGISSSQTARFTFFALAHRLPQFFENTGTLNDYKWTCAGRAPNAIGCHACGAMSVPYCSVRTSAHTPGMCQSLLHRRILPVFTLRCSKRVASVLSRRFQVPSATSE